MVLCGLSCVGIRRNIAELHFKENLHTIYVMSRNTLEIYISGITRDFKSCVIRDSAGIVVRDRCSGLRGGERLVPNDRRMD